MVRKKHINKIKFLFLVIIGFLLATMFLLHVIKHDRDVYKGIEKSFTYLFRTRFAGIFSGTLVDINFIHPSLTFADVTVVSPVAGDWLWHAQVFQIGFSWLDFFVYGKIRLKVLLNGIESASQIVDNKLLIFDHLRCFIFNQSPIPIGLKELHIKKGDLTLFAKEQPFCTVEFHAHAALFEDLFKLNFYIQNGTGFYQNREIINQLEGHLFIVLKNFKDPSVDIDIHGHATVLHLDHDKQRCVVRGFWKDYKGQLIINNKDKSVVCAIYDIVSNASKKRIEAHYQVRLPLHYIAQLFFPQNTLPVHGTFLSSGICWHGGRLGIEGSCFISALHIKNIFLEHVKSHFFFDYNRLYIHTALTHKDLDLHAIINMSDLLKKIGSFSFSNEASIPIPFLSDWIIKAQKLKINALSGQEICEGSFECIINHQKIAQDRILLGHFIINKKSIVIDGSWCGDSFLIKYTFDPEPMLDQFEYYVKGSRVAWIEKNKEGSHGKVLYDLLMRLLGENVSFRMPGKGIFDIKADIIDNKLIGTIDAPECHIIMPGFMNALKHVRLSFEIDPVAKSLICNDISLRFDKGLLSCKHASIFLDDSFELKQLLFPCTAQNFSCNIAKNLFAIINGMLTYSYSPAHEGKLAGFIVVERSQLKQNIFSAQVQHDLVKPVHKPYNCAFDVSIQTKEPLVIKAPLLETAASLSIFLRGSAQNPQLSGTIDLIGGNLLFPYRPLHITSGKIYFLPHQLHDPIIEFTAKGKVRKYHVMMHCSGSVKSPHITFESAPALTEEQIITLLLAGSEEGALSLAMPSLALHQFQKLIFGADDDSKAEKYLKNILGPLRHIKFVPRFTDQTARGGFRGLIEIDVANQLRALIQKNFSLTEDTKLEIEYYLSDDVTIRGIRDERGDLGAEVEMRLKF